MVGSILLFSGCQKEESFPVTEYEEQTYNKELSVLGTFRAKELCVSETDCSKINYVPEGQMNAAALFDVGQKNVLYMNSAHERIYPASITKNMTALLALEHGNLTDEVVISKTAAASNFHPAAQVCGLEAGEVWTLKDLLNALLLYSGNDVATAIAEHIAGSEEAFVQMMNEKAKELLAFNTHFMNPHGLHEKEHYTTAYDIYLIFQECIKNEEYLDIIHQDSCTVNFKTADGIPETKEFKATNWYAQNLAERPENVTIIGGKTGTTNEGGYCLILLEQDAQEQNYISVVMGAQSKPQLYRNMTALIQAIP